MPIDRSFRDTWRIVGRHEGHHVWQSVDDESTEIHGRIVGVDLSICNGCEKCIEVCQRDVFALWVSDEGSFVVDPIREKNCILCLTCEVVCPVDAISIESTSGSEDTLKSLLQDF